MPVTMDLKTIAQRKESFQYWLLDMDDSLEHFISKFKKGSIMLDYSITPLDPLEKLILATFRTVDEIEKDRSLYDEMACYVGETFRRTLGGAWKLDLENKSSAYYNLPILDYDVPICPHKLITACIYRREGNFLSGVLTDSMRSQSMQAAV